MDSGVFRPMQVAAAKALTLQKDWFDKINKEYRERQKYAFEIMETLGCTVDRTQGGLFVWARVADKWANAEAQSDEILNKTGVFITPGFIFGSNGNRYVRISLCATEENMRRALDRINNMNNN